ncbi:HEXXH motif-containing putative peptide modification protein [Streptomyces sp. NL15-2K]|uniref:aKG-HExxH-type peptide beta-hydroxylase n=1 Tax=Streptomyces sp. NL15-2K TaxID=376149 RepID=UPI000F56A6AF|nr:MULTISPECIES: HEXXH motif-containing putative peptide modification protein [Actinomycetes]WKX15513.1 HEXXH motif-containing putative peptide modification protein [Kutzneria buriramensis]GCB52784.1 hypothetical protein SNL152K_10141 [Streptomyces sp. NL15-2K]
MGVDRGLIPERAAEIIVRRRHGRNRRGSGYLVAPGRVLTAAHVVKGAVSVRVRFQADRPGERTIEASVVWRHVGVDAAVLALQGVPVGVEEDVAPVRFGQVSEWDRVVRCTALGFPRFKLRTHPDGSRYRDSEHVHATCALLSNRREGTLDLKVDSPPDDDPDQDPWEGMSGAAVFCNGHLVGVVSLHHRTDGRGRIAARRVDRWTEKLTKAQSAALTHALGGWLDLSRLPDSVRPTSTGAAPGDLRSPDVTVGPYGQARVTAGPSDGAPMPLGLPGRQVSDDQLRGRDALVAELTDAVRRRADGDPSVSGVWVLSGMGGSGKTTVALEAAHRLKRQVRHVWWVSAAQVGDFVATLRAVAYAAGAREAEFSGRHPADVLWDRLNALTTPWLLIMDNVDDPSVLEVHPEARGSGWLRQPAGPQGTVLITSRLSRAEFWAVDGVHMIAVDVLSTADGARVLCDLAPTAGDEEEACDLAEHLGGLPLALNLAGSYLKKAGEKTSVLPHRTFTDYRRQFEALLATAASDPDMDGGSRRTIPTTYELSLGLLDGGRTKLARPLLRLLCALGPTRIPHEKPLDLLDQELLATSGLFEHVTHERLQDALDGLSGLNLIRFVDTAGAQETPDEGPTTWISIHPVIRAANRPQPDFRAHKPLLLRLVTAQLNRCIATLNPDTPEDGPLWRAIAPHCTAPLELLPDDDLAATGDMDAGLVVEVTEPAVRAAEYHRHLGMYGEAVTELTAVSRIRARALGDDAPATIVSRLRLGWMLRDHGSLREADQLYQEVVRHCERALPDGHPYLQSARTGRARVLRELARYEEAETELRAALAMRLRDSPANSVGILRIRHDLATLDHKRGRPKEAATELRDVVRRLKALTGDDDLLALAMEVGLVRGLRDAGDAGEAEALAENVVRRYLRVRESDHPDVLLARHERARLLRDRESDTASLERAREELTDVWRISERRIGPDHPDTIAAQHELASVWHRLGRPDFAGELFRAALESGRRRLGEHHPAVALCARHLALALLDSAEPGPGPIRHGGGFARADRAEAHQNDVTGNDHVLVPAIPDLTRLALQEALSPQPHPATERLLARYVRPHLSRGGAEPGGAGMSQGWSVRRRRAGAERAGPSVSYGPAAPAGIESATGEEAPPLLFPSPADVLALAAGEEDHHLIEQLRGQQRGARAVVLGELLRIAAAVTTGRTDESIRPQWVRDLLLQAERANPGAVSEVLRHPCVGRWMSRALRALYSPPGGPRAWSGTPPADLSHLYSIAAAAGFNAGVALTLPLSVRDGFVFLPGLGAADFSGTGATAAQISGDGRTALIRAGSNEVMLPSRSNPRPRGWVPVTRVRRPVRRGISFDLVLEDRDPYRQTDGPVAPRPLGQTDVTHWRRTTREAADLLARVAPRQAETLATALTSLTPWPRSDGAMASVSSSDAFGGAVISSPPDAEDLAVTLLHEFRHMKLNAVLDCLDLYEEGESPDGELFYAPWRDDPRPLPGFFHGVFAFFGVSDFWRKLVEEATGETLRRAQFQLAYWRAQTRDAYVALCSSPRLTAAGREFAAAVGKGLVTWFEYEAVPEEIAAIAMDAVMAHRVLWRLHHLHPAFPDEAEVADAWRSKAPCPPMDHRTVRVAPGPSVPSLGGLPAQLYREATDPSHNFGDADEACRLAIDEVTRSPQRHERWMRLALVLRRACAATSSGTSQTAAAAQTLTHWPELVRATHIRLTAAIGRRPHPVELAAWLGESRSTTDRSALPPMYPL